MPYPSSDTYPAAATYPGSDVSTKPRMPTVPLPVDDGTPGPPMPSRPILASPLGSASVIGIRWIGANGTELDLVNGRTGVFLTRGMKGVHLPDFKFNESKSSRAPGRRINGITWGSTKVELAVTVADTYLSRPRGDFRTGAAWVELDRSFMGMGSPLDLSVIEVTTPSGAPRRLAVRLEDLESTTESPLLPDIAGRADYDVTLSPDHPFWTGTPIVYDFPYTGTTSDNYYGGTAGVGPPFYISKGNALGSAVVLNPGQVESWPTWTITGPAQATVGVGEHLTYVQGLSSGERITIVTDPSRMDVTDENGERAWHRISSYDFAGIPPGESSDVSARIVGGGAGAGIRMDLTPNYLSWY